MLTDEDGQGPFTWPVGAQSSARMHKAHLYMGNTLYIIIHPIACDPGLLSLSPEGKTHIVFHVPGAHMMALASPIAHSILCSVSTWSNTHPLVKGPLEDILT